MKAILRSAFLKGLAEEEQWLTLAWSWESLNLGVRLAGVC